MIGTKQYKDKIYVEKEKAYIAAGEHSAAGGTDNIHSKAGYGGADRVCGFTAPQ